MLTMTRKEWIEKTKRRLDEWDASMDRLEEQADDVKEGARLEYDARLEAARAAQSRVRAEWERIKDDANEAWEAVSGNATEAWEANRNAVEQSIEDVKSVMR